MTETIKVASFTASRKSSKSDKLVPAKIKDGNDREFAVDRSLADFVGTKVGQSLEIEFTEKQNGQFTNRLITTAVEPAAQEKNGWKRDPAESKLIIRQTALKAAVELFGALYQGKGKESGLSTKPVLQTAELFADWVTRVGTLPDGPVEDIPW